MVCLGCIDFSLLVTTQCHFTKEALCHKIKTPKLIDVDFVLLAFAASRLQNTTFVTIVQSLGIKGCVSHELC